MGMMPMAEARAAMAVLGAAADLTLMLLVVLIIV